MCAWETQQREELTRKVQYDQRPKLVIGLPHTGNMPTECALGLANMEKPMPYATIPMTGQPVDTARNLIVRNFLEIGADWLFFLDSDIVLSKLEIRDGKEYTVPDRTALMRMISRNLPILTGVYYRRSDPPVPGIYKYYPELQPAPGHKPIFNYPLDQLFEVDAVGAGCLLIKRGVFLKVPYPWFFFGEITANEFCVIPGQNVFGGSKIEEMSVGEEIWDESGGVSEVARVGNKEYHGKIITIKPIGSLPFTVTPEHGILIYNNNNPIWKPAGEINKNDLVGFPILDTKDIDEIELPQEEMENKPHNYKILPKKIKITLDLLELFGLYVAEGYATDNLISFCFNKKTEQEMGTKIQNILKDSFGLESSRQITPTALEIRCCSSSLAKLFISWFGKRAKNKHFPKWMLLLSEEKVAALIRGTWLGDGCNSHTIVDGKRYNYFAYSTVSHELAVQIYAILTKLRITSTLNKCKQGSHFSKGNIIFVINCMRDAEQLAKILGETCSQTNLKYRRKPIKFFANNILWSPVQKIIIDEYNGYVYDIHNEPRHSFILGNTIVRNSEDFAFCHKARKYGFKTICDPTVQCDHYLLLKVSRAGIRMASA